MPTLLREPKPYRSAIMDSSRWRDFRPRADDIIIATFAKVGTTWMQRIVDLLVFQSPEPRPLHQLSPWLDATIFAPLEADLAMLEAQTHRRFIKSHLPFDAVPLYDTVKYIHVARDGRDAAISMHNHQLGMKDEVKQRIGANAPAGRPAGAPPETPADPRAYFLGWIAQAEKYTPGAGDLPFFEFENTYWSERRRPNVLFVNYGDLKRDLQGEMARISTFLDIDTPASLLPELARAASFDGMKSQGDSVLRGIEAAFDRGADRFLNKGIHGRWKDVLNAEDSARYEALLQRKLSPSAANWLTNGRLVAGDPRDLAD
jgi:aryl sulfotransferase